MVLSTITVTNLLLRRPLYGGLGVRSRNLRLVPAVVLILLFTSNPYLHRSSVLCRLVRAASSGESKVTSATVL